jgi:hypothetical protein
MSSSFFTREPYFLPPFLAPPLSPDFSCGLGASFGLASGFFAIVCLTSETRADGIGAIRSLRTTPSQRNENLLSSLLNLPRRERPQAQPRRLRSSRRTGTAAPVLSFSRSKTFKMRSNAKFKADALPLCTNKKPGRTKIPIRGYRMRFAEMDDWRNQWVSYLTFLFLEYVLIR